MADLNNDSLIGQFLGDFVKGRRLHDYGDRLGSAILFHRKIDSFSDTHPVIQTCRNRFKSPWRRFAGVIVDVCYDHFLARHWEAYSEETLVAFTRRIYAQLDHDSAYLAELPAFVLSRMITHNWLTGYYHLENVGLALDRIADRLTRGTPFKGSLSEIKSNYHDLKHDFELFFPDLIDFSLRYMLQKTDAKTSRAEE